MTKKDESNRGDHLAFMVIALPVGIFLADVVGRVRAVFLEEWPYISWGLLILFVIVVVVLSFREMFGALHNYEEYVEDQLKQVRIDAGGTRNTMDHVKGDTSRLHEKLTTEMRSLERLCNQTIKKVDDLLEQKGPLFPQAAAPKPDQAGEAPSTQDGDAPAGIARSIHTLEEAMSEIVKGVS